MKHHATSQKPLSPSLEDYLEAVYVLSSGEKGARMGDIAKRVGCHKSTVTAALHALAERALVHYEPYKPVTLTAKGKQTAARIYRRHKTLRRLFTSVLGIEAGVADATACSMEHYAPPEVIDRLAAFADWFESCPSATAAYVKEQGYFCAKPAGERDCERCEASRRQEECAGKKRQDKA